MIKPKDLQDLTPTQQQQILGGKAFNLWQMQQHGFKVPKWVVFSAKELDLILPKNADLPTITSFIEKIELPKSWITKLENYFSKDTLVAVRSSALIEDGAEYSFAGQFESYLFIKIQNVLEYLKKVWLSAYTDRVSTYRKINNITGTRSISIIVQEMIDADVSGVGFGINAVTGNRTEHLLSAVYGLGEGLVSGALNADTYILKNDGTIEQTILKKDNAFRLDASGQGIVEAPVEGAIQEVSTLDAAKVNKLRHTLKRLHTLLGRPQDIEFAFKNDEFYLLQTRPITTLQQLADKGGQYIIWDNSNIIESYPGVTTPLTFSFILDVYEAVYAYFSEIMGVRKSVIEDNEKVFANMLGLLRGRVYYNLFSWYRVLALFPAYSLNAEFMENMMGVKERFELPKSAPVSKWQTYRGVARTVAMMLKNLFTLPRQRRKFLKDLNETMTFYGEQNFLTSRPDEIMNHYFDLGNLLIKKWKVPLINDFFAMIYFGILQKLIKNWDLSDNPNLHNDLLAGSQDIISTEPVRRLLAISNAILNHDKASTLFKNQQPRTIWLKMTSILNNSSTEDKDFYAIATLIQDYINKFGDRCVGELKLETISYSQAPEEFIAIVKSYVEQGIGKSVRQTTTAEEIRETAENDAFHNLRFKPIKKRLFLYVLKTARSMVSARENLRYERTRLFGLVRRLFTDMGKIFHAEGIIEETRDIFYLTKEEIFDYISGTSVMLDLKGLIALRKKEFATYHDETPPSERIPTYGVVYHANDFYIKNDQSATDVASSGMLQGIGCCKGIVKAKVRVVRSPNEIRSLDGDILVTSSTDPGWVTLFPSASGILVERGSLLSHSAIVSRELGIPCVVSITGLLATLKTGDMVEMNGSTGEVRILED